MSPKEGEEQPLIGIGKPVTRRSNDTANDSAKLGDESETNFSEDPGDKRGDT